MTTDPPSDSPQAASAHETAPAGVDATHPHKARIYDYFLGGKDNFAADRDLAEELLKRNPQIRQGAQANRRFLVRAVRMMVSQLGIRQFLDLGSGLPTSPNVHEVAQDAAPGARVVYVDNDPMVLVHARALLTSSAQGATAYLDADVRDMKAIVAEAAETLDLTEPVGVTALAVFHFLTDEEVGTVLPVLRQSLAPGSAMAISHVLPSLASAASEYREKVGSGHPRSAEQINQLLDGWSLVPPGLVDEPNAWRPDPEPGIQRITERESLAGMGLCGVAVLEDR